MSATFKERLIIAMENKNMKSIDLSEKTGISKARISQYVNGVYIPKSKATLAIAKALDVSETWLMGLDVPMERENNQKDTVDLSRFPNIKPITKTKLPMLGEIACGKPIFAEEEHETFVEVDDSYGADFCLQAKGDSMINAGIDSKDIVLIREAPIVENGEIAAVIIDDEATLKRVYYYKDKNKLVLQAENPKYEPLVYLNDELNSIRILGKAVAVIKRL